MDVHTLPILNSPPTFLLIPSPLGHPSAPALSTLSHALNLDWRSVSHMIIYMFQCYIEYTCSLKSSHPRLLPESKRLFFTSVSLLLSCIQGHHFRVLTSCISGLGCLPASAFYSLTGGVSMHRTVRWGFPEPGV